MSRLASNATCVAVVLLCATVPTSSGPGEAASEGRPLGLADIRSIYVANFGSTESHESARAILMVELGAVGFAVSEDVAGVDAVLSGTIVTKLKGGEVVVILRQADLRTLSGESMWSVKLGTGWRFRKFGPGGDGLGKMELPPPTGCVQRQARNLARALWAGVEIAVTEGARNAPR
jgi:hypothetical protein